MRVSRVYDEEDGRKSGIVPVCVVHCRSVEHTGRELGWSVRACLRELKGVDPVLEGGGVGYSQRPAARRERSSPRPHGQTERGITGILTLPQPP